MIQYHVFGGTAIYTQLPTDADPVLTENSIHSLGRIGVWKRQEDKKIYELKDHLGNVRVAFSRDPNTPSRTSQPNVIIERWADYYPFGGIMPGRSGGSEADYAYTYQGQRNAVGSDWHQFDLRMYSSDIGRFMSPDPYGQYYDKYLGMGNNPINGIDPDGGFFKKAINWFVGTHKSAFQVADKFTDFVTGQKRSDEYYNHVNYLNMSIYAVQFRNITQLGVGLNLSMLAIVTGGAAAASFAPGGSAVLAKSALAIGSGGLQGGFNSEMGGGTFGRGFLRGSATAAVSLGVGRVIGSGGTLIESIGKAYASNVIGNTVVDFIDDGRLTYESMSDNLKSAIPNAIFSGLLASEEFNNLAAGRGFRSNKRYKERLIENIKNGINDVGTVEEFEWASLKEGGAAPNGGEVTVYIENDGLGHVYIESGGNVYTYGRYDGSYSPVSGEFGPVGPGVLQRFEGADAVQFISDRTAMYPTDVFTIDNIDINSTNQYFKSLFNSGDVVPGKPNQRYVDVYFLVGNNCASSVCNGLKAGGASAPNPYFQTPSTLGSFFRNGGSWLFNW